MLTWREALRRRGSGCVKSLVNKNLMGTEKAVIIAVRGGGAPVMLWVIGWTRAWKELVKAFMSGQG